jgi:tetratricopeptide (TPR) repeat protein
LKLAEYYINTQDYDKAIIIYKKALRKEKLNPIYRILDFLEISKVNLVEPLFVAACLKSAKYHFRQARHYVDVNTITSQLFDMSMTEYGLIDKLYREYQETFASGTKDNKEWSELLKKVKDEKIQTCFAFGEGYVKKKMWKEARNYYTREILKYLNPIVVLEQAGKLYNTDSQFDIKRKIWGEDIFVVLEDFEDSTNPVLIEWTMDAAPLINAHTISNEASHKGSRSEYLDLSYSHQRRVYDYWMKPVNLPLSNSGLSSGIRLFIKSSRPFQGNLGMSITYLKEEQTAIWKSDVTYSQQDEKGWEIRKIEDLYDKATSLGLDRNWNITEMVIDSIIIDTKGISAKFYVDDIELYLPKEEVD